MLVALGRRAQRTIQNASPWTNIYGTARSILALSSAMTLLSTPLAALFHPIAGGSGVHPSCVLGAQRMGLFCQAQDHMGFARWLAIGILLVVATGFRPRWTAIPHWWIALSISDNATLIEGGDQLTANLALLMIPIALTDPRKWHWQPAPTRSDSLGSDAAKLVAVTARLLIQLQVAVVYFHAAVGKLGVEEWKDGTVLYYWLLHPTFGAPHWLSPVVSWSLKNGAFVAMLTWGVIALEYLLSAALFMPKRFWPFLLVGGFGLHAGIVLIHGLFSFGMVMFAALILYLRPWERPFTRPERRAAIVAGDAASATAATPTVASSAP